MVELGWAEQGLNHGHVLNLHNFWIRPNINSYYVMKQLANPYLVTLIHTYCTLMVREFQLNPN